MSSKSIENTEQVRELERAVLGGLMLETERYDAVSEIIEFTDFEGQDHQNIFQSMGELVYSNKPLDPLTVSDRLDSKNLLTRAGGKNYLIDLASTSPSAANLEAYAGMIRQKSISRRLMKINSEISELIINPQGKDAAELLDEAETKIFSLNDEASRTSTNIQKLDELIPQSIERMNEIAKNGSSLLGASTGYKDLDSKLQGLQNGDLIIVAARPSMGKTALSMNIVENLILNKDIPGGVLVFSLEMPAESLTTRLLASNAKIDQQKVRSASMNQSDLKKFMESSSKLKDLPLYIDDSSMLSPMELRARARRIARQEPNGLSLIVVDYLQLMQLPASQENRVNQISEISRSLKMLAKELNVPVIALSQLNRAVEQRPNKRPIMADLRDSGAIEQDADVILFIYRDEVYNEDSEEGNKAEIIIGKQRNGPIGKVNLTFLKEFTRFEDFAVDSYYDSIQ
ncbi:MAG: replicative DNA helicase [SAR86 cluster bacterium]|jgi:replicative DNA helicase|nr:replicative DNA helicase [SAR86 cluster bacterium]MDA8709404.1 replicative DNA helicase [Gammaproteobacteria bacterium]MBL6701263.1 replicative DNA helicase [SAR86 cluster bacterium]MBL6822165.1 replicative DNA helicase [SAR86 cluster bacterium]MDA8799282.1 replicative DNA helicase [Gammaproteobacteria bacterium]